MSMDYDDDYPTCSKTRAGLRIDHDDLNPERIIGLLGIEPSETQVKGRGQIRPNGTESGPAPIEGWFLSTHGVIYSRDLRRDVDWILDKLVGKDEILTRLQANGYRMDIFCYRL
jgi:hypothetical protein